MQSVIPICQFQIPSLPNHFFIPHKCT
jgi:hypothetical protein